MVGLSGDSLQPLLTWKPGDPGPRPGFGGTGENVRYRQGTIIAWDPETAHNVVRIDGADHSNVPLIGGLEQRVIAPGDQVAIMSWAPNGGTAAYFIVGRLVVPGTSAALRAAEAVEVLALEVVGRAFRHDESGGGNVIMSQIGTNSWGDGSLGVGPVVSDVEIGPSGTALVWISADINNANLDAPDNMAVGSAHMSVEISGETERAPGVSNGMPEVVLGNTYSGIGFATRASLERLRRVTGLNPGLHTFTCRYMGSSNMLSFQAAAPVLVIAPL